MPKESLSTDDLPVLHPIDDALSSDDEVRRRLRRLFAFLRAFAERRAPNARTLAEVGRKLRLGELPDHPAIRVGTVSLRPGPGTGPAADDEPEGRSAEPLLAVRRPSLTRAPAPPALIADWVLRGWERPDGKVAVWNVRDRRGRPEGTQPQRFGEDPRRTRALTTWRRAWNQWAEAERPAREAMRIFETLYALFSDIERQGERIELVLGDGRLSWQTPDGVVDHPVLLQRVDLVFDPAVPEFRVVDSDRAPELYAPALLAGGTLSGEKLNELQLELERGGYHPLAGDETTAFLRRLVSLLGPTGTLRTGPEETGGGSPEGPTIVRDAFLFARDRAAGLGAAFDGVLEDLDRPGPLPAALCRIAGFESPETLSVAPEQAEVFAADPSDLLLSKPANAEQIAIARALGRHGAVLVQGPPGTGKSHTIANLIGHLVAHGKRVLVTSYTTKALRVLRDHVVPELRPLCVSVLDNDLDGRAQMEEAVRGIVHRLSTSTESGLADETVALERERERLVQEAASIEAALRDLREGEYRPILLGDEEITPANAARHLDKEAHRLGFIPGPVPDAGPLPLDPGELEALYASNDEVSADAEQMLAASLPLREEVPDAATFAADVELCTATRPAETGRYWSRPPALEDIDGLKELGRGLEALHREIGALAPWQRQVVAAGRGQGADEAIWRQLAEQVENAASTWHKARPLLLDHAPHLPEGLPRAGLGETLEEIQRHVADGGGTTGVSLLFRGKWKAVLESCRVAGKAPTRVEHFAALAALARVESTRQELRQRWTRQAEHAGLPAFATLPDPPEPVLDDYVQQFERLLGFWSRRFGPLESALGALGFSWEAFRADEVAKAAPSTPFESDLAILSGPLRAAIEHRIRGVGRLDGVRRLKALSERLAGFKQPVCRALGVAAAALNVDVYGRELRRLEDLWRKADVLAQRRELLRKLAPVAPEWASAIERRRGVHGGLVPPRDLAAAWRWRQLRQELDRRGAADEPDLERRLSSLVRQLREVTVDLVDRKAWLAQLRRTGLPARQALIGWADTQRKIGKGTGKRAPALQIKARELLTRAREAVPVWIMPLARVAESFDPRHGKFDVVIVDEASQCDLTGLLALYLGQGAVIVGDHEQVSPSAIGETVEDTQALISQFLGDIPNSHLYDGQTSVYDLARQSFGGTISLREHFRCVPEIIAFSNQLSYHGEIRPLRDPHTARRPHTVEYPIPGGLHPARTGKVNEAEAKAIAALVAALLEQPEYEGKTLGAISLLGDDQAARIQALVQRLCPLAELGQRRFVAGNPAQFQGDERDVVFLSMVDVPEAQPLPMQERLSFKQRYNVAASRAKDQLWLVHSLDPARDLQVGDLRRRLIQHVREPAAATVLPPGRRRARSAFEDEVAERLGEAGFRLSSDVQVGGLPLDLVVSDGKRQVAIVCEGDRVLPEGRLGQDMAREAVLARVGWRILRLRATRYFADRQGVFDSLVADLDRLGIERVGPADAADTDTSAPVDSVGENLRNKVVRRAWKILREQDWVEPAVDTSTTDPMMEALPPMGFPDPKSHPDELVLDDTTEPNFVILEQWEES